MEWPIEQDNTCAIIALEAAPGKPEQNAKPGECVERPRERNSEYEQRPNEQLLAGLSTAQEHRLASVMHANG
eukprot:1152359-Pelagomonas_calceolata.AAC.1